MNYSKMKIKKIRFIINQVKRTSPTLICKTMNLDKSILSCTLIFQGNNPVPLAAKICSRLPDRSSYCSEELHPTANLPLLGTPLGCKI